MPRQPSPATQIKNLRRLLAEAQAECRSLKNQRDTYQSQLVARVRDVEEWKLRFDALLKVMPPQEGQ